VCVLNKRSTIWCFRRTAYLGRKGASPISIVQRDDGGNKMRLLLRVTAATIVVFAGLCGLAWADEGRDPVESVAAESASPNRTISIGSTTVDGKQWQRIAFRPEIPFGNFAVALDFELFVTSEGNVSSRGWKFGNGTEFANSVYRKIYYVRYGTEGDPLYARIGALDDVTLGYGFVMNGYRNTLDYPGTKNLGMNFEVRRASGLVIEGMMNNFLDISTGGPVVGVRVGRRLTDRLEVGGSLVVDFDQYGGLADSDGDGVPDAIDRFPNNSAYSADTDRDGIPDELDRDADGDGRIDIDFGGVQLTQAQRDSIDDIMTRAGQEPFLWDIDGTRRQQLFNKNTVGADRYGVLGFDVGYHLIEEEYLGLTLYGQFATSIDDDDGNRAVGYGFGAPGFALAMGPLRGRIEYRHIRNEFLPEYFDNLYDHKRAVADFASGTVITKDSMLDSLSGQMLNGVFAEASMSVGGFARVYGNYQYLHGTKSMQQLAANAGLDSELLKYVPKLSRVEGFYSKTNIGMYDEGFFAPSVDTFYGYNVGFELGGGVEIIWSTRWIYQPVGGDLSDVEAQKQINFATVISF